MENSITTNGYYKLCPKEESPMAQFCVKAISPHKLGGVDVSITNSSLVMVAILIITLVFFFFALKGHKLIPSRMQMAGEMVYNLVANMVRDNAGKDARRFLPLIFAMFCFILVANLIGLLPYQFSVTAQFINELIFALAIFVVTTFIGFARHGLGYCRMFFPHGTPLIMAPLLIPVEIVSYIARPITLTLRLFANITAGHAMLFVFAMFIAKLGFLGGEAPFILDAVLIPFELFVAIVQAFVFALLACVYLHDAYYMH